MTINFYKALLFCALSCSSLLALGQTQKAEGEDETKKSGLDISLNYLSNSVFMGRADSVRTSTISPVIKYRFSSGIYLSAGLELIPGRKKNKLDGGDLTLGYDFDITDDLSGGISYSKLFYNATSTQVGSAVSSTFSGNFTYNIGDIISPTLTADYNINKQGIAGDIFLNLGVCHDFTFGANDELSISPTIEANTGTQNFYDGYLVYRKLKNAKRTTAETALIQAYTAELSQYRLLDYEFSLPVEYSAGNFTLKATPIYAVAQNEFKSAAVVKALGLSSQTSVFYFDIGVSLKF
jgi:hypothetical protein